MLPLILASASPRRRELLASLDRAFTIQVADIDESPLANEDAATLALRLAREKAAAVRANCAQPALVLAADTVVSIDGQLLAKPVDAADSQRMLQLLAGREHQVITAIALDDDQQQQAQAVTTRVWFRPLTLAECKWYWASGEPADKAGGYAIQGLGSRFIERIDGSYSNVVGLPLVETERLLQQWPLAAATGAKP